MKILGIETSCDETAAAVISDNKEILSNVVLSQIEEHAPYGGVVPEIAARAHIIHINHIIEEALAKAECQLEDMDGIAVTAGPGLIGGVIVGLMTAKGLASVSNKPLIAVNHLEGHALTVRLTEDIAFPYLMLLMSGGHCQFLAVEEVGKYKKLGATMDDALGEAFDKVAKMLGLGYPGGPKVEQLAKDGDKERFAFPRSLVGRDGCDFSFSGLKTAVKREVDALGTLDEQTIADICASFQAAVSEILTDRVTNAMDIYLQDYDAKRLVIAGGVAANQTIRKELSALVSQKAFSLHVPPVGLCTDNAAMIAWVGVERLQREMVDDLSVAPKARWSLD